MIINGELNISIAGTKKRVHFSKNALKWNSCSLADVFFTLSDKPRQPKAIEY